MDKQKPTEESIQIVKSCTETLLNNLKTQGEVTVAVDETDAYRVHIESEDTGVLIGYHGRTLESFQILLAIICSKELGYWVKTYVNVGDYREKREETLMYMAQRTADRVIESGRPVELHHLSPAERRVIHLTLSGDDRVITESSGEGDSRVLLVKPKA